MPELNPGSAFSSVGAALLNRIEAGVANHVRTLEYFNGNAVGFNETPTDNLAAFNSALDWCAATGGLVVLGAGVYGVDGPIPLQSYANITGLGVQQSYVRQLASTPTDVFTSGDGAGQSLAYITLSNFTIDGGWAPGWNNDRSTHTAAGLRLIGDFGGPDDPVALAREDKTSLTDPYHVIQGLAITGIPGTGIVTDGRGEIRLMNNNVGLCSLYGMDLAAPDCWFSGNTIRVTGDSAVRVTQGNQRFSNEKYWFCGMRTDQEGVGAGLEISGASVANLTASNLTTQDTWGPALALDGDAPRIDGNLDEAGGGRVEQQNFGMQTRTIPRSVIHFTGPAKRALVNVSAKGGLLNGEAKRPCLVYLENNSLDDNQVHVQAEGIHLDDPRIVETTAYTNLNRYNLVTMNGEILHGKLTPAQLADATHKVNAGFSAVQQVYLTDGSLAIRDGSGWRVFTGASVTPS